MGSFIEHDTIIHGPDAGIQANVNQQKKYQKDAGQSHHPFFSDRGGKNFRPFHGSNI
jgi:hypothetical protein